VNCQECRRHLHPYLDSELEVPDNLSILEHLNTCGACQEIFEAEEAALRHVKAALTTDIAPTGLPRSVPHLLQHQDHQEIWRRAIAILVPLGVAATLIISLIWNTPSDRTPPIDGHEHGTALAFAVDHFLNLRQTASNESGLISLRLLAEHAEFNRLEPRQARAVYKELLGREARLPPSLDGDIGAARADGPALKHSPVEDLLLIETTDKHLFGLYVLDKSQVELSNLQLIEDAGVTEDLRVEHCPACRVIALTRGEKVFLMVASPDLGVDPMIQLVKKTF